MSLEHNDKITWVEISKLKPHPKNPNKHSKEQIERLAEIIAYQGFRSPIVVSNRSGYIVAGHGRVEAAILNELTKVPVSYQDFTDDEQEYAHMTADNAIADWATLDLSMINKDIIELGPDFNVDMLGIKDFEIEPADKYEDKDADAVPEKVEPKAKIGQIYKLGEHRLMCGDSTDIETVEKLMNGAKADMLFTSPPYGVGLEYNSYDDSFENTKRAVTSVLTTISQKVDGYICLNWGDIVSGQKIIKTTFPAQKSWLPLYDETLNAMGFYLWAQRIWKKPHARCSGIWSASSNRPVMDWEYIFTWSNGKQKTNKRQNGSHFGIIDTTESGQGDTLKDHPGAFPVMVAESVVLIHTSQSETIIDPFGGTGTTLIACEKTNRRCFMMELDPHYVDVIIARWEQFTGKKAELING